MHAWESIQKTLDHIEENLSEEIQIDRLADIAGLSLFYYQRLFTRLVKASVRDYIKLRRLAKSTIMLRDKTHRIIDIAMEYGFGSHISYTRAFTQTYGITPSQYRSKPIGLQNFEKPDLFLNHIVVNEGEPLISDGIVLEMNHRFLEKPIDFLGVTGYYPFVPGKMVGEKLGIDKIGEIWDGFYKELPNIPHILEGRFVGVSYRGDAPIGYSSYFVGVETLKEEKNHNFTKWQLPVREYIVCGYEVENHEMMIIAMGKTMKYTRFWLKEHGLIADGFYPEMYYGNKANIVYSELWIPFRSRG